MAYSQCPSFDVLVPAMLEHGPLVRPGLRLCTLSPILTFQMRQYCD